MSAEHSGLPLAVEWQHRELQTGQAHETTQLVVGEAAVGLVSRHVYWAHAGMAIFGTGSSIKGRGCSRRVAGSGCYTLCPRRGMGGNSRAFVEGDRDVRTKSMLCFAALGTGVMLWGGALAGQPQPTRPQPTSPSQYSRAAPSRLAPPQTARPASAPAKRCLDLKHFSQPGLVVEDPQYVPAGPTPVSPGVTVDLPAHCLFRATLAPRTGPDGQRFGIGFELRLPARWNGGFEFQGGAGLDGVLSPSYGATAGASPPGLRGVSRSSPRMGVIAARP